MLLKNYQVVWDIFSHLFDNSNLLQYVLVKTGKNLMWLKDFIRILLKQILRRHATLTAGRTRRKKSGQIDRMTAANIMKDINQTAFHQM